MQTLKDLFNRADLFAGKPILTHMGRSWALHGRSIIYGNKRAVKRRVRQSLKDRGK